VDLSQFIDARWFLGTNASEMDAQEQHNQEAAEEHPEFEFNIWILDQVLLLEDWEGLLYSSKRLTLSMDVVSVLVKGEGEDDGSRH
jgi:hypothetical protein